MLRNTDQLATFSRMEYGNAISCTIMFDQPFCVNEKHTGQQLTITQFRNKNSHTINLQ